MTRAIDTAIPLIDFVAVVVVAYRRLPALSVLGLGGATVSGWRLHMRALGYGLLGLFAVSVFFAATAAASMLVLTVLLRYPEATFWTFLGALCVWCAYGVALAVLRSGPPP